MRLIFALALLVLCARTGGAQVRPAVPSCMLQDRQQVYFAFQVALPAEPVRQKSNGLHGVRPFRLRADTVPSPLVLQFIVDTNGRVEASTVRAFHVQDSTLLAAVLRVVPQWRFRPALLEAYCYHVRQLVRLGVAR